MFKNSKHGFTLIELVIVTGIMSAIMLFVVFNSRKLNDGLILKTAATDISLSLRQAQNFRNGVVFSLEYITDFFVYTDKDSDRIYDGNFTCTGTDECITKTSLRNGVTLSRVCATDMTDVLTCFTYTNRTNVVTYVRPNPEPVIRIFDTNGVEIVHSWKKFYVELASPRGTVMYVVTDTITGQISIQNAMP